jgi:uncharacterized protein (DUF58 family)
MAAVAQLSPTQQAWRTRIEAGLRLAAPFLDLVLAAGDRLSRAVERDDAEQVIPARSGGGYRQRALGDGRD